MRTRFLNTDFFSVSSSTTEILDFFNLPPPHLPPSHLSNFSDDLSSFDLLLEVPLETERLPIDAALFQFLSEAVPRLIDVDFRDFEYAWSPTGYVSARFSEKEARDCNEREGQESQTIIRSEIVENDNVMNADDKNVQRFDLILLETPELDTFLDKAHLSEKQSETLSRIPEIEYNKDETKLIVPYSNKIQELVYSVEDVTSAYNMEENNCILEEDSSSWDRVLLEQSTFPLLEVDELSLGILTSHSMDDVLRSVFESIESQLWTQENYVLINNEEFSGSIEFDSLNFLSDHCLTKQFPEPELAFPEMFLDVNLICMVETPQIDGISELYMAKHDAENFLSLNLVIFEEFQVFDMDSSQAYEVFLNGQMTHEPEACDQMFSEAMNLKSFNELVVSNELVLADNTFKSMPAPVLSDYRRIKFPYSVAEELLSELKPLPLSACDGIYLDWYILEDDEYNYKAFSLIQNMVKEIDSCNNSFDQETFEDGHLVYDFIFSEETLSELAIEKYEEALTVSSDSIPKLNGHLKVVSGNLQDNGCPRPGNSEQLEEKDAKRASVQFKSMSQFNDLDFFLNPRKASSGENAGSKALSFNQNATLPTVSSSHLVEACTSTGLKLQQWDIKVYNINLSDDILTLIKKFEESYLAIIQNETEITSFLPSSNFELLSISKKKLMECIEKKMARRMTSHKDEDIMAFFSLCAIKQMAWYMCFYGIHAAKLYLEKLCGVLGCLKSRMSFLHSFIEDTCGKVDKEIIKSHPSLSVIQEILQSNISPSSSKVLVMADQVFWLSLKNLFMSMGLSCNELSTFCKSANSIEACNMDSQLIFDCWLVSHEHVCASFPFNKFNLIVEYGGSCDSSRVSSLSTELVGLTHLHFLKIELDSSSASKALCDGADTPQTMKKLMEGELHSTQALHDNVNYQKLEDLLNFVPTEDNYKDRSVEGVDKIDAHCMPPPVAEETKQNQEGAVGIVIIVNTQNSDKEMIISRRSTYQKILALEKEGAQVVERDSNLPVDIILTPAVCLVWYDCGNIRKKDAALDEVSSSLPLCIENIATNVLTLLSFSFNGCFLVFEGEIGFLSTIMESSAGLYAAAAGLGIDFQLFCSYSSEFTDEIILNCIHYAAKTTRGLYPKMPDSETLAESFLTKFPSINPLTAHAILSSEGMLTEFLEWSDEQRIHAFRNYCLSEESVALFGALCKYGEREDSKSIMTDCSSSVSSGPCSKKCYVDVGSEGKHGKQINNPHNMSTSMDELLHAEPLKQWTDDLVNPSGLSKQYVSWMPKGSEVFHDCKEQSSSLNDIFDLNKEFDFPELLSSQVPKQYDPRIPEGPQMLNEAKKRKLNVHLEENIWGYKQGENMAMHSLDWQNIKNNESPHKDLIIGEVIDLTDSPISGKDFSSFDSSILFSSSVPEIEKYSTRKSKISRRSSFVKDSNSNFFPYVSANNTASDIFSVKNPRVSFQGSSANPDIRYNDKLLPSNQENHIRDSLVLGSAACRGALLVNDVSNHGATPLSKAIASAHTQQGSPWTVEFLNRIREKSKLRHQNFPLDASASSPFEISGNIAKVPKRSSPSIFDFFKYQGGNTPRKTLGQRKQKSDLKSSSSSKDKKVSTSLLQASTPIDKRARQTLSFAMNESGSQTKLVWTDRIAHGLSKKLRNQ